MDKQSIVRAIAKTAEIIGTPLSPDVLAIMASDLVEEAESEQAIGLALARVRKECKYKLTLADILERLPLAPRDPNSTISPETIARARLTRALMAQKRLESAPGLAAAPLPSPQVDAGEGARSRPLPGNFKRPAIPAEVLENLPPIPGRA